jgi:hypothetical protein
MTGLLAGPNALAVVDRFMAILLDAGFSASAAINVHDGVSSLIFGFASASSHGSEPNVLKGATGEYQMSDLSPHDYPGLVAVLADFNRTPSAENFRRALRTFLDGVEDPRGV